jgi:hypothetical protein
MNSLFARRANGHPIVSATPTAVPQQINQTSASPFPYDVSSPGQYTMRAYRTTTAGASPDFASAVLDVRTVGGR